MLLGFGGVAADGPSGPVELGGPKQRAVLALLMLEPGSVVPLDRMIDRIWADAPPPRAEVSVRGYVSNLRKALVAAGLGPDAIDVPRSRLRPAGRPARRSTSTCSTVSSTTPCGSWARGDLVEARSLLLRARSTSTSDLRSERSPRSSASPTSRPDTRSGGARRSRR